MTYEKPEVTVLGNATSLIESNAKIGGPSDGVPNLQGPAYELDE